MWMPDLRLDAGAGRSGLTRHRAHVAPVVCEAMHPVMHAKELPPDTNISVMAFLPKEVPQAEVVLFSCEVALTRPILLSDTIPKVYVLALNDRMSSLAAVTMVGQQSGFAPGRVLADGMYEAEAAMISFSVVRLRSSAAVFFDFKNAFPPRAALDVRRPHSVRRAAPCDAAYRVALRVLHFAAHVRRLRRRQHRRDERHKARMPA